MLSGFLKDTAEAITDVVYPLRCPLCDTFVGVRDRGCSDCMASLNFLESDALLDHLPKIWFTRCRSCFAYEGRIKDAIHGLKYGERLDIVRFLGDVLATEAVAMGEFETIVPVPLHPARLRSRGFNQSVLLARQMGRLIEREVDLDSLKRSGYIRPQVGLQKDERIRNVKGAFNVRRAVHIMDKNILLVDDVLTTGATVNECASVLIRGGAASVSVLTVART